MATSIAVSFPRCPSGTRMPCTQEGVRSVGTCSKILASSDRVESQSEIECFVKSAKEARANFIEATTRGLVNCLYTVGPFGRDGNILKDVKLTSPVARNHRA